MKAHSRLRRLVLVISILLFAFLSSSNLEVFKQITTGLVHLALAEPSAQLITPTISFGSGDATVTITYGGQMHTFYRPTLPQTAFSPSAGEQTLWVATNGNDNNPGTSSQPFRTINRAIAVSSAGDVIYVRPGIYEETVVIAKSGQPNAPIVLSAAPGTMGSVRIRRSNQAIQLIPADSVLTFQNSRYFWVNGFVIEGALGRPGAPINDDFGANGVTWSNGGGIGTRLTNSVIFGNVHCGIKEMGHGGSGMIIEGNIIFANGTNSLDHGIYMPGNDAQIIGNIVFDNSGFGIHAYDNPQRLRIIRNITVENVWAGIILAGDYAEVYNNVSALNRGGILYFREHATFNTVKNNIFAFNWEYNGDYDTFGGSPHDNIDDYNIYFGLPNPYNTLDVPIGPHTITANPLFVNAQGGDYRLNIGSPAINAGTNVGLPYVGGAPDIGAFETVSSTTPTPTNTPITTPTNVNLLVNGDFSAGVNSWTTVLLNKQVVSGVMSLTPATPNTWGYLAQSIPYPVSAGQPVEFTVQAANTSSTAKSVLMRVSAPAPFNHMVQCSFSIPANTPLTSYQMRFLAPASYSPIYAHLWLQSPDTQGILLDNLNLQIRPQLVVTNTECTTNLPTPSPNVNLISNGDFAANANNWSFAAITPSVIGSVLRMNPTGANVWGYAAQTVPYTSIANQPFELNTQIGNPNASAKTILMRVSTPAPFTHVMECSFSIPANSTAQTYTMQFLPPATYGPMLVHIWQLSPDTTGVQMDNVNFQYKPSLNIAGTQCQSGAPPSNTNLLLNGSFTSGVANWTNAATIPSVSSGVLTLSPTSANVWGYLAQTVPYGAVANQTYELSLQIGNSSASAKTILLRVSTPAPFNHMAQCSFTVPGNSPLQSYSMRLRPPANYSPMLVHVWQLSPDTTGVQMDNVNFQYLPSISGTGVECPPVTYSGLMMSIGTSTLTSPSIMSATATNTPTYTSSATETATAIIEATPTSWSTQQPTEASVASATSTYTATWTFTPEPPTETFTWTPEPPTNTLVPPTLTWTFTSEPPTETFTWTPEPPTATPLA